jgi:hypothetical protein
MRPVYRFVSWKAYIIPSMSVRYEMAGYKARPYLEEYVVFSFALSSLFDCGTSHQLTTHLSKGSS